MKKEYITLSSCTMPICCLISEIFLKIEEQIWQLQTCIFGSSSSSSRNCCWSLFRVWVKLDSPSSSTPSSSTPSSSTSSSSSSSSSSFSSSRSGSSLMVLPSRRIAASSCIWVPWIQVLGLGSGSNLFSVWVSESTRVDLEAM